MKSLKETYKRHHFDTKKKYPENNIYYILSNYVKTIHNEWRYIKGKKNKKNIIIPNSTQYMIYNDQNLRFNFEITNNLKCYIQNGKNKNLFECFLKHTLAQKYYQNVTNLIFQHSLALTLTLTLQLFKRNFLNVNSFLFENLCKIYSNCYKSIFNCKKKFIYKHTKQLEIVISLGHNFKVLRNIYDLCLCIVIYNVSNNIDVSVLCNVYKIKITNYSNVINIHKLTKNNILIIHINTHIIISMKSLQSVKFTNFMYITKLIIKHEHKRTNILSNIFTTGTVRILHTTCPKTNINAQLNKYVEHITFY